MKKQAAAGKLVTAIEHEEKKPRLICLCGAHSPHAKRTDCIVARPGTPWWNALNDAEPDEDIVVQLPGRTVRLKVTSVEELEAANVA